MQARLHSSACVMRADDVRDCRPRFRQERETRGALRDLADISSDHGRGLSAFPSNELGGHAMETIEIMETGIVTSRIGLGTWAIEAGCGAARMRPSRFAPSGRRSTS